MAQIDHDTEVLQYKERFKKEAEELFLTGFPLTILKLNALLMTPKFKKRDFRDMHQNLNCFDSNSDLEPAANKGDSFPPSKRPRYDDSASKSKVSSNKFLVDLIETVKPFMIQLVEDTRIMKMWISYMIPMIEDGHKFGMEVHYEITKLVKAVENYAALFYEGISKYYGLRGRDITKIIEHPGVEDFKRTVQEMDEGKYVSVCLVLSNIRNHYCSLYDFFLNNLDKLKAPRTHQPILYY